jgi:hypothetical protein
MRNAGEHVAVAVEKELGHGLRLGHDREVVQHAVVDLPAHLLPSSGFGECGEFLPECGPAVQFQHRAVGGR